MDTLILGGGMAGLSLADLLGPGTTILEKDATVGGLCRSYDFNGVMHDVGPHIIFSKKEHLLKKLATLTPTQQCRRSNKVFFKGNLIRYPFENDLGALPPEDRELCLHEFLSNPYAEYPAQNMLQFFLKTFGEGITRLYLQPYNEKIWKMDPAYMSLDMVERIPKPPAADIIKSAHGEPSEGHLHQLHFYYPVAGGIQAVTDGLVRRIQSRCAIKTSVTLQGVEHAGGLWRVSTDQGVFEAETLVNCMPVHELFKVMESSEAIKKTLDALRYNSLYLVLIQAKSDRIGDHLAVYFPQKELLFHRVTRLNYFGANYVLRQNEVTLMAEITFRPGSRLAQIDRGKLVERVIDDLQAISLLQKKDITDVRVQCHQYGYVIQDIEYHQNRATLMKYLEDMGILSCGRFAEFKYHNMDDILDSCEQIHQQIVARHKCFVKGA